MSYWVSLNIDGEYVCTVENFEGGGTYVLGGSDQADINVTYNYSEVYSLFGWNIKNLHGRVAASTIPELTDLASKLPNRPYKADYWAPTPGNAGAVIHQLLGWARQYPSATWRVN